MDDNGGLDDFYAKKEVVPKFWREKYDNEAHKFWDKFYQNNTTHFFKDRHWLTREFPELLSPNAKLLEVGCGVGNTIFPLLQENSTLYAYGIDFSQKAIALVKGNEAYNEKRCQAFVCDISRNPIPEVITSVDSLASVFRVLRPGGVLLFRDYAVNDGAHKKMTNKKAQAERKLAENFYVRGDGTQVIYFEKDALVKQFVAAGFEVVSIDYIEKETVNHKEEIKMDRSFVQARSRKPNATATVTDKITSATPPPAAAQT